MPASQYNCIIPGNFPYELDCDHFYRCYEVLPGILNGKNHKYLFQLQKKMVLMKWSKFKGSCTSVQLVIVSRLLADDVRSKNPNLSANEDAWTIDVASQPGASALIFKTFPSSFDINLWSSYILKILFNFWWKARNPG